MENWQKVLILLYGLINLIVFIKGFFMCRDKKAAYTLTPKLTLLGIFAWGDAVVFGLFWFFVSLASLILNDSLLFLFIISVFWVVRSFGETIYWFNQQFAQKVYSWNEPQNLKFHWLFHNDSIWYGFQIFWQCISVISIIASVYLGNLWLRRIS